MIRLLLTNVPDLATGTLIARTLVEEGLVACVNLLPGATSIYRWQGVLEEAGEVAFVAKTTDDRLSAATARLCELHPYELPEVLTLEAGASEAYGQWVEAAVGDAATSNFAGGDERTGPTEQNTTV